MNQKKAGGRSPQAVRKSRDKIAIGVLKPKRNLVLGAIVGLCLLALLAPAADFGDWYDPPGNSVQSAFYSVMAMWEPQGVVHGFGLLVFSSSRRVDSLEICWYSNVLLFGGIIFFFFQRYEIAAASAMFGFALAVLILFEDNVVMLFGYYCWLSSMILLALGGILLEVQKRKLLSCCDEGQAMSKQ